MAIVNQKVRGQMEAAQDVGAAASNQHITYGTTTVSIHSPSICAVCKDVCLSPGMSYPLLNGFEDRDRVGQQLIRKLQANLP